MKFKFPTLFKKKSQADVAIESKPESKFNTKELYRNDFFVILEDSKEDFVGHRCEFNPDLNAPGIIAVEGTDLNEFTNDLTEYVDSIISGITAIIADTETNSKKLESEVLPKYEVFKDDEIYNDLISPVRDRIMNLNQKAQDHRRLYHDWLRVRELIQNDMKLC